MIRTSPNQVSAGPSFHPRTIGEEETVPYLREARVRHSFPTTLSVVERALSESDKLIIPHSKFFLLIVPDKSVVFPIMNRLFEQLEASLGYM